MEYIYHVYAEKTIVFQETISQIHGIVSVDEEVLDSDSYLKLRKKVADTHGLKPQGMIIKSLTLLKIKQNQQGTVHSML